MEKLDSGYAVSIRLKGPFALDHITQAHPYPPAPTVKIVLGSGEVHQWPYTPQKEEPTDEEERTLWYQYRSWKLRCAEITLERQRAQAHYFMTNHIKVESGPGGKWLWKVVNIIKWFCRMWGRSTPTMKS